jgi:hypothetical protein
MKIKKIFHKKQLKTFHKNNFEYLLTPKYNSIENQFLVRNIKSISKFNTKEFKFLLENYKINNKKSNLKEDLFSLSIILLALSISFIMSILILSLVCILLYKFAFVDLHNRYVFENDSQILFVLGLFFFSYTFAFLSTYTICFLDSILRKIIPASCTYFTGSVMN